ncbi:MAG: nucleotidyltransferase domain-containing protein [Thermomicrobium sp.]
MPVRSLHSSVLRWPSRAEVLEAVTAWAQRLELPGLVAVGVFGSYARGDAGVGSDLNLVVILEASELPFERRMTLLPLEELPVPAEALVYTRAEWEQLGKWSPRLAETLRRETVWVRGSG